MYLIRLCLLLYGISVHLCLPPETLDYIEIGAEDDGSGGGDGDDDDVDLGSDIAGSGSGGNDVDLLDWDESNELNVNQTNIPNNIEFDESITEAISIQQQNENATNKLKNAIDEINAVDARIHELSTILKQTIHRIRQQFKKIDIIFLIDSSSSVGKSNFHSELRFVIKFLSDFNVSYNYTRVSILTFSSQEKIVCTTCFFVQISNIQNFIIKHNTDSKANMHGEHKCFLFLLLFRI